MSLFARRERSDAERRRFARVDGPKPSANWSEIECELIERRRFRRLAKSYGLEDDATWDDLYDAWRWRTDEHRAAIKVALFAAIPGTILLLVWTHWIMIVAVLILFVAALLFGLWARLMEIGETQYHRVHSYPEIMMRAKRDGIVGPFDATFG